MVNSPLPPRAPSTSLDTRCIQVRPNDDRTWWNWSIHEEGEVVASDGYHHLSSAFAVGAAEAYMLTMMGGWG